MFHFNRLLITSSFVLALAASAQATAADATREAMSIVGSSTVYPFSATVAEQLGKKGNVKTPKVEATGTGGGIKLFCSGLGPNTPDIVNASRRIKKAEFESCQKAGVKDIAEIRFGYDGIVLAQSIKAKDRLSLTRHELYLALAKKVPDPKNPGAQVVIDNPYKTWKEINPNLPAQKIQVLGPPPSSGTRDAFVELALEPGCQSVAWIKEKKASDEAWFKNTCMTIREDGAYVEVGENDNLIVQKIEANPSAVGIFGFSFLDVNDDKLHAAMIDGQAPVYETIIDGKYPISRPLFFYVKKAHVGLIPGISDYVTEFLSDKASGPEGYLADKGLIALPGHERKKAIADAKALASMPAPQ
jgi:phosphate transport system substrate-binding protein